MRANRSLHANLSHTWFLAQYKRVGDIVNYSSEASPDDVKLAPKSIVALEGMSIFLPPFFWVG